MKKLNQKLIVCGMALLLFGINIAIMNQSPLSYIAGGLGLFFVIIGCFAKQEQDKEPEESLKNKS